MQEIERDVTGRRRRVTLDGADEVLVDNDPLGREIRRALPGGGRIETTFDALSRVTRRRALGPPSSHDARGGEPELIGPTPTRVEVDLAYRYSPAGEMLERWDAARGSMRLTYDPLGQLISVLPAQAQAELYRYDASGNLFEASPGAPEQVYGPGGRLLRCGDTEYVWDAAGRLREARTRSAATGREEVQRYHFTSSGLIEKIERPDGTVVEFWYDAFARRLGKRTLSSRGLEQAKAVAVTRFVWNGDMLVHEIKRAATEAGDPIVVERTYCFDDEGLQPWAHREMKKGPGVDPEVGEWLHYVNDPSGMPDRLITSRGEVAFELRSTVWGRAEGPGAAATPLRFSGQYHDEETGLSYNRFRYYDPALGRYLSADPLGLLGGLDGKKDAIGRGEHQHERDQRPDGPVPLLRPGLLQHEDRYTPEQR